MREVSGYLTCIDYAFKMSFKIIHIFGGTFSFNGTNLIVLGEGYYATGAYEAICNSCVPLMRVLTPMA